MLCSYLRCGEHMHMQKQDVKIAKFEESALCSIIVACIKPEVPFGSNNGGGSFLHKDGTEQQCSVCGQGLASSAQLESCILIFVSVESEAWFTHLSLSVVLSVAKMQMQNIAEDVCGRHVHTVA